MRLSAHFTLEEAVASQTALRKGIDNTPSAEVLANMTEAATQMEEVRSLLNDAPIFVSSWFRCPKLNSAIGGSATSAHVDGWAIDFTAPTFGTPKEICTSIWISGLTYDQLIWEFKSWVHISFDPRHRRQALTAHFGNGKVTYTQGIA
jgi:zinc D-Ala-D-Ala carboxypeptidase